MDLFEYQGKSLYQSYEISHPKSVLIKNLNDLEKVNTLNYPVVVKAQVQVGGRGKAGGIKVVNNYQELEDSANAIFGMDIKGHKVEILLVEEASEIYEEYYISFTLDRSEKKYLMMLSSKGGMDIEQVAKDTPDDLIKLHISPSEGLIDKDLDNSILNAKLNQEYTVELIQIIKKLFELFVAGDCDLVEVNPLAITSSGVMALDAKVALDMNAKFKHENFQTLEDEIPIPEEEKYAKERGLNFIKLDGSVGIIGNGAGLVMSTLDVVAEHGGNAANFLDIGGGAQSETVSAALEVLETDPNVKSVLINIFGGITRCDLVAEGIVKATKGKNLKWPIVIRLDGIHALRNRDYGTKIVAGTRPGKGGENIETIPIFNTVEEAIEGTGANVAMTFVPPAFAKEAVLEAAYAGCELVVCITEGIPAKDEAEMYDIIKNKTDSKLLGPNCPGLISPGKSNVGIMPHEITKEGNVGVVSRSGTLTYQAVHELTQLDIGQSTCIGIGGDPVPGMSFIDVLSEFEKDSETSAIVMIGEIGGSAEEEAAEYIKSSITKPVVSYIAGVTAPPGKKMGHAGAIVSGNKGTAKAKMEALNEAGAIVVSNPTKIGKAIEELI